MDDQMTKHNVTVPQFRHGSHMGADGEFRVSVTLPAVPGIDMTADRAETAPTGRTIKAAAAPRRVVHGAAHLALVDRAIDAIAARIVAASASGLPSVTAVMEARE